MRQYDWNELQSSRGQGLGSTFLIAERPAI